MKTPTLHPYWLSALWLSAAAFNLSAQTAPMLGSPIAGATASKSAGPAKATSAATAAPAASAPILPGSIDLPAGSGPGIHSPNSPFAPLSQRADVVPWSVLTDLKTKLVNNRILPNFNLGQLALHQKNQRIQGFMVPLEPGQRQRHFLLTSVPMTCSFCTPGGPESMVEVRAKTPVAYGLEPVVVEGRFLVLNDDPYGLYYRITEAVSVK